MWRNDYDGATLVMSSGARRIECLLSPESLELAKSRRWRPHLGSGGHVRVQTGGPGTGFVWLARLLVGGVGEVDHVNGNTLDNRLENLRAVTHAANMQNTERYVNNTSGYRGVSWDRSKKRWRARVTVNGKPQFIGCFESLEAAADAACAGRQMLHCLSTRVSPEIDA